MLTNDSNFSVQKCQFKNNALGY